MAWSDVTPTTSTWYRENTEETVWDSGATQWDLFGNIYDTVWDDKDNVWAVEAGNSVSWADV